MNVGGGGGRSKNRSKNKNQKQDRLSPPANEGVTNGGPNCGKDNEVSISGEAAPLQILNKRLLGQITSLREENGTLKEKLIQMESRVNQMPSLGEENGTLEEKLIQMQAQISNLEALKTNLQSERDNLHGEQVQLKEQLEESRRETEQLKERSEVCEREIKSSHAVQSNLEATVFELRDQIQVKSAELEAARKAWELEKDELLSQTVEARKESEKSIQNLHGEIEENQHLWNAEKTNLESTVAELQTKLDMIDNERKLLSQKNTELSTEAQSLEVQLNESESKLNDSKGETKELYRKIKEDRHLWDAEKSDLEGIVSELKTKFDLTASEKLSVSRKNGELSAEVESLKSLLNESKGTTQELHEKIEECQNSWAAEKSNLESIVAELKTKLDSVASERVSLSQTNGELINKAESLKVQLNELQSNLDDSKGRTLELCRKIEKDRCLWDVEKNNLEGAVTKLQSKFDLIDSEREILSQKNTDLSTEVQSLKTELVAAKEVYDEASVHLNMIKEEKEALDEKLMLQLSRNNALEEELFSTKFSFEEMKEFASKGEQQIVNLQSRLSAMAEEKASQITDLQGQLSSLAKAKMLTEEKNSDLERGKLVLEEEQRFLKDKIRELETAIKSLDEDLKASRAMTVEKEGQFSCLQYQLSDLAEEKKCLEEKVNSTVAELQIKLDLMDSERELLSHKSIELNTELQSLNTELVAAKSAYDTATTHLNNIKEEKEALDEKLTTQLSRNNALEEELLSTKSSLEAMKESASKGEQQIANLQSQLLAVEEKKDGQIVDIQSQFSAMAEEKRSQLADLQDQLSALTEAKMFLEEKNVKLQREILVSEKEQLRLEGGIRDREASMAIAAKKEGQLSGLQYQLSDLAAEKKCLEEKYNSLLTKLNKCTLVSEENVHLQDRIKELETHVDSLTRDFESRDIMLQKFKSERQDSQLPECAENGKPNCVHATGEPNCVPGKPKPKPAFEKQKPKRYYAWSAVASTGALAAAVVTAYLKFSK